MGRERPPPPRRGARPISSRESIFWTPGRGTCPVDTTILVVDWLVRKFGAIPSLTISYRFNKFGLEVSPRNELRSHHRQGHRRARIQRRLRHRHRVGDRPRRTERGRDPPDLGQEGRARVAAGVAPEGVPALADDEGAGVGERAPSAHRLPVDRLLLRAQATEGWAEEP